MQQLDIANIFLWTDLVQVALMFVLAGFTYHKGYQKGYDKGWDESDESSVRMDMVKQMRELKNRLDEYDEE